MSYPVDEKGREHDDKGHERLMEAGLTMTYEEQHHCAQQDDCEGQQVGGVTITEQAEKGCEQQQIVVEQVDYGEPLHCRPAWELGLEGQHAQLVVHVFTLLLVGQEGTEVDIVGDKGGCQLVGHLTEVFGLVLTEPAEEHAAPHAVLLGDTELGVVADGGGIEGERALLAVVVP